MITINLRGETRRSNSSHTLQIGGYAVAMTCLLVAFLVLYTNTTSSLNEKIAERDSLQMQLDRLKTVTKEVRDLEAKKQQLSERLAVIATLKKNKIGPVRVLDDLNMAMPEKAWLTGVQELSGPKLNISGMALDNQTIASFMKQLEDSDYFSGVDLVETKQKVWQGVNIKEFTLSAGITYAGQILAKPTPVAEGAKS